MSPVICPNCNATINKAVVISRQKLLIVEGADEEHFFAALLKQLVTDEIQVLGIGGKTQLRERLKGLKLDAAWPTVHSVGIVRDADDDPEVAFKSVCFALEVAELPIPKQVMTQAVAKGKPSVMVMIIPSVKKKGALEDLCLDSVSSDPAMPCVDQYFQCLTNHGLSGPKQTELNKARVKIFLGSREEPTLPLGIAAEKGYWPLESGVFDEVKRFISAI